MREAVARVRFLAEGEGGRSRPPTGPTYSTVSRFPGDVSAEAWSLVLEFMSGPDLRGEVIVRLRFLSPQAPTELLEPGMRFELLEGARVVARGEVVEWCSRLQTILRESGDDETEFNPDLAANYWREGLSPREFYRDVMADATEDSFTVPGNDFDPRWDL
jgi:hypothetical protein